MAEGKKSSSSPFNALWGWGISTLLLWLLNRDNNSSDDNTQEASKYTNDNTNQIGSSVPVVLGRAMIKSPLVSYYGDFRADAYTEEYGMHTGIDWRGIIPIIVLGILAIALAPDNVTVAVNVPVVTDTGAGTANGVAPGVTIDSGTKRAAILAVIVEVLLWLLTQLFSSHGGRTTIQKGFKYYLGWQHILCWTGDNCGIKKIWMNVYDSDVEDSTQTGVWGNGIAWKSDNPSGIIAHIADENMFGGVDEGGGFVGDVRFYFGTSAQPNDSWMINQMNSSGSIPSELRGLTPKYPMYMTCVIPQAYIGKQATIPEMWFEVVNYPTGLHDLYKYKLQGIYNNKITSYVISIRNYINNESVQAKQYISTYYNPFNDAYLDYIKDSQIKINDRKTLDNFNTSGIIEALNKNKVDATVVYENISKEKDHAVEEATNDYNTVSANATSKIADAQKSLDLQIASYDAKEQEAQKVLDDAKASGNEQAIQEAQSNYDIIKEQCDTGRADATVYFNNTKAYYDNLVEKANLNIKTVTKDYDDKLATQQEVINDIDAKIQDAENTKKELESNLVKSTSDTSTDMTNLKTTLNTLMTNYPEKESSSFKTLAEPLVSLLAHDVWHLGRISDDINPAEAIYEILVNDYWGCAYDNKRVDIESLVSIAITLEEEEFGISALITASSTVGDYVNKILSHVNGMCFDNPYTGKLTFKLIRNDYNEDELKVFSTDNCESMEFTRLDWSETNNNVTVSFTDADNKFDTSTLLVYDNANEKITHNSSNKQLDASYFTTLANAKTYAQTNLLSCAYPLSAINIVCNRYGYDLTIGEPIVVYWKPYGITKQIYRITDVDYGSLLDGKISITAIEDIFGFEKTDYEFSGDNSWTEPENLPMDIARYIFVEQPYELSMYLNTHIIAYGARPSLNTVYWNVYRYVNSAYTKTAKSSFFSLVSRMVYGLDASCEDNTAGFEVSVIGADGEVLMDNLINKLEKYPNIYNNKSYQNLIYVDDEIMTFDTITKLTSGNYIIAGVLRGICDTLPEVHTSESIVYIGNTGQDVNSGLLICDEGKTSEEQLEITTESESSETKFELSKLTHLTTRRRTELPSVMANLLFGTDCGDKTVYSYNYPATNIFAGDLVFKFYTRNKFNGTSIITQTTDTNIEVPITNNNYIQIQCNNLKSEILYDSATYNKETMKTIPITTMRLSWGKFCSNMAERVEEANTVTLNIGTFDTLKSLYSYNKYTKKIIYKIPIIVGIFDVANENVMTDIETYITEISKNGMLMMPLTPVSPEFTVAYTDCPLIFIGKKVALTDETLGEKIRGNTGEFFDLNSLEAYRVDGLKDTAPVYHKIDIDNSFILMSKFTTVESNTSIYYKYSTGFGWLPYTLYTA